MKPKKIIAALLLLGALSVLAQPPGRGGRGPGGRGNDAAFLKASPRVGEALPELAGYDDGGKAFSLSQLKGGYRVLIFGCLT